MRASHAKSSACVTGELTIAVGLPPELAQGLFANPGTHPVAVRFAQGPGETLGDRVSTHRGMSIKVFDVPGEKLPGHSVDTQDFVLATGTTFPSGTAAGFLRDGTIIKGVLDDEGKARIEGVPAERAKVRFGPDKRPWQRKEQTPNPAYKESFTAADADALVDAALGGGP